MPLTALVLQRLALGLEQLLDASAGQLQHPIQLVAAAKVGLNNNGARPEAGDFLTPSVTARESRCPTWL